MLIDLDAKRHLQVEETKKLLYEEKVYSRGATTGCLTERAAQHAHIDKVHRCTRAVLAHSVHHLLLEARTRHLGQCARDLITRLQRLCCHK